MKNQNTKYEERITKYEKMPVQPCSYFVLRSSYFVFSVFSVHSSGIFFAPPSPQEQPTEQRTDCGGGEPLPGDRVGQAGIGQADAVRWAAHGLAAGVAGTGADEGKG